MPGADPSDYAIRLGLWLAAREQHRNLNEVTTLVRREPLDRSSSAYTIAETDVAAALARATELESENRRLRAQIDASYQWAIQLGPEIRNHTIFVANSEADARQLAETTVGRSPETYLIRRCNHTKHGWVTIETLDAEEG